MKIASRCNLNCSYCYVYNQGDRSYRSQPKMMQQQVVDAIIAKAAQHCLENQLPDFLFSFHGGEPLLAGPDFFRNFVGKVQAQFKFLTTRYYFTLQSNGTLITEAWSELLAELQIQVGISLDGKETINDRYRVYKSGKGSYQEVISGIEILRKNEFHRKYLGLLMVADIQSNPAETYEHLKKLKVAAIDFLLPYHHYDSGMVASTPVFTPYADWLIAVFNLWYQDKDKEKPGIRMFQGFMQAVLGEEYPSDVYGSYFNELLVIETDGMIEAVDYLKTCGDAFTKTRLNILSHDLAGAIADPLINLYYHSHRKLHKRCQLCPVREICGGGSLASRFSRKNGFNNPSLYCFDLLKFIAHIRQVIVNELAIHNEAIEAISYEELANYVIEAEKTAILPEDYNTELEKFSTR